MAHRSELVRFRRSAPDELVEILRRLAVDRDGWVNLQAVVDEDDPEPDASPARAGIFGLVSGRGPDVPVATWVPGPTTAKGPGPDSLGIEHAAGARALQQLLEAGVTPPAGFRRTADHARRGLVLEGPAGTDAAALLEFLLAACDVLATRPLPDAWAAAVHHR